MAKKNLDQIDTDQIGKQLPNGQIYWHDVIVAEKLGWSTPEGRDYEQVVYNEELVRIGIEPSVATELKFFSRRRYVEYTAPQLIVDTQVLDPNPASPDEIPGPAEVSPLPSEARAADWNASWGDQPQQANDGPDPVGTAIDVSGTEDADGTTHIVVDESGLLVGQVTAVVPSADPAQPVATADAPTLEVGLPNGGDATASDIVEVKSAPPAAIPF